MNCNYIAGKWLAGPEAAENVNPSDTSYLIGLYTRASARQCDTVIAAGRAVRGRK